MPRRYKRRNRRTRPRRRYRRTHSAYPGRVMPGFPSSKMVKMRYSEVVTVNPGVGTLGVYNFSANGIFDPNLTGVGHQPLGHDEWAQFYNHYTVAGAKISAVFTQESTAASTPYIYGCLLADDTTVPTSATSIIEQGLSKYKVNSFGPWTNVTHDSKIYNTFSTKKFFNIKDLKDNQMGQISADFGANPAEQAVFHLFCGNIDTTVDPGNINILVTIDYVVICREPKSLNQS